MFQKYISVHLHIYIPVLNWRQSMSNKENWIIFHFHSTKCFQDFRHSQASSSSSCAKRANQKKFGYQFNFPSSEIFEKKRPIELFQDKLLIQSKYFSSLRNNASVTFPSSHSSLAARAITTSLPPIFSICSIYSQLSSENFTSVSNWKFLRWERLEPSQAIIIHYWFSFHVHLSQQKILRFSLVITLTSLEHAEKRRRKRWNCHQRA